MPNEGVSENPRHISRRDFLKVVGGVTAPVVVSKLVGSSFKESSVSELKVLPKDSSAFDLEIFWLLHL